MATEGQFPKTDGDDLYASEVNLFQPKVLDLIKPTFSPINVSGTTAYVALGSLNYVPGTNPIRSFMALNANVIDNYINIDHSTSVKVLLSGTGISGLPIYAQTAAQTVPFTINFIVTSGLLTSSGGNIGSNYSLIFYGNSNINGTTHFIGGGYLLGH